MATVSERQAVEHLLSLRNADGGFPPARGGDSEPEPTALAALALDDADARAWIEANQRDDGGFVIGPESVRSDASTPLAALALSPGPARDRAIGYLLGHQAQQLGRDERFPHDADTSGWGWTSLTFGWVEPTARALHALKLLEPTAREAIADGRRVLEDRECVGGGWNYGNRVVLGRELEPYLQTTAAAVIALHDEAGALRDRGLAVLEALWPDEQGGLGWSMTLAALRLCGAPSDELSSELSAYVEQTGLFDDGVALGWAAIALGDGIDRLRVTR
jgi:hypothetical protein